MPKKLEGCIKSTEVLHVFGPPISFFGGGGGSAPEFLDSIYKIDTGSDHVAKFRGDRPRELGDYALKKNTENFTSKIEDLPYYRTGGLIIMSGHVVPQWLFIDIETPTIKY